MENEEKKITVTGSRKFDWLIILFFILLLFAGSFNLAVYYEIPEIIRKIYK